MMHSATTTTEIPLTDTRARRDPLLSDEPTIELVTRARAGDGLALEALLQRCLPALKGWAHSKLPPAARGAFDTGDLVQEAVLRVVRRLDIFKPRHVGAIRPICDGRCST
jgi:hypothetical protein